MLRALRDTAAMVRRFFAEENREHVVALFKPKDRKEKAATRKMPQNLLHLSHFLL